MLLWTIFNQIEIQQSIARIFQWQNNYRICCFIHRTIVQINNKQIERDSFKPFLLQLLDH